MGFTYWAEEYVVDLLMAGGVLIQALGLGVFHYK